jgi:hypothetical protein
MARGFAEAVLTTELGRKQAEKILVESGLSSDEKSPIRDH